MTLVSCLWRNVLIFFFRSLSDLSDSSGPSVQWNADASAAGCCCFFGEKTAETLL